ncbi:MAG: hypothetical protein ACXVXL_27240, partial [Solirubrobacteraceae bacterium]
MATELDDPQVEARLDELDRRLRSLEAVLLHASGHGKFRTKGRYAAATVRGTIWTTADRCDGTLVHAIKDTVT